MVSITHGPSVLSWKVCLSALHGIIQLTLEQHSLNCMDLLIYGLFLKKIQYSPANVFSLMIFFSLALL